MKVVLAAPLGEEDQIHWLSTLRDVLKCFECCRKLGVLELETEGFDQQAYIFFGGALSSLLFTALKLFTSLTIPHSTLARFLSRHRTLRVLNVGYAICPQHCPLKLPALKVLGSIYCAASCVSSIVPGKRVHHACVVDSARSSDAYASFLGLFGCLRQTSAHFTRLEITFPSTEMEILPLVASAAPNLVNLTLVEIGDPIMVSSHSYRYRIIS